MLDPGEFPGNVAQLSLSISFLPASQAAWSIFLANPSGKIVTDLFDSSGKCSMVRVKSVRRLRENTSGGALSLPEFYLAHRRAFWGVRLLGCKDLQKAFPIHPTEPCLWN